MLLLQETMAESCGREILQKGLGFNVDFGVNQEIISSKTMQKQGQKEQNEDESISLGRNCASNKSISSSSNSGARRTATTSPSHHHARNQKSKQDLEQ